MNLTPGKNIFSGSKGSLILIIFLLFLSFVLLWNYSNKFSNKLDEHQSALKIQNTLLKKSEQLDGLFVELGTHMDEGEISLSLLRDYAEEFKCDLFVLKNDSVKYWTSNLISLDKFIDYNTPIIKLNNGWYFSKYSFKNNVAFLALISIKKEYRYTNNFLQKSLNPEFDVNDFYKISLSKGEFNIWDKEGEFLFSIRRNAEKQIPPRQSYFLFVLFVLFLFMLLVATKQAYKLSEHLIKPKWLFPALIIADATLIWMLINAIRAPNIMFESDLYSPVVFQNKFKLSIASYFINTVLALFIVYVLFYKRYLFENLKNLSEKVKPFILLPLVLAAVILYEKSVLDLFTYYKLSFQFGQDFINTPGESIIVFVIFSMLSYGLFILLQSVFIELNLSKSRHRKSLVILSVLLITGAIFIVLFSSTILYSILIFAALIISMYLIDINRLNAIQLVFYLIIFSLYLSVISSDILSQKELNKRHELAEKLSGMQDPMAEFEFKSIERNVYEDTFIADILTNNFNDSTELLLEEKIKKHFEIGEWDKYTSYVTICDSTKVLNIQPEDYLMGCSDYFNEFITNFSDAYPDENLIHLKSTNLNNSYIAQFNFDLNGDGIVDVYIFNELISEFIPEGVGYTELFSDDSYEIKAKDIINYSFARYENNELVYKFGSHFYNSKFNEYSQFEAYKNSFEQNGYNHLVYESDENNVLIISRPTGTFWEKIAPFSYFFIVFSVFVLVVALFSNLSLNQLLTPLSFKKKIQFSLSGIILFSFFVIGFITLFYIVEINNNKNKEILNEKAHSVLVELEHKLSSEESLQVDMSEYLNSLLNKFSLVFFTDINLYNLKGNILASSRPRIVDEGLISPIMNPQAYRVLTENKKLIFIQDEAIGKYNYLSAYLPFRNADNQIIAYLNLPYFARQSEIQKEITNFLVALVNIYLLLFVMAIIMALVISRTMSKPLEVIKNRIGHLQLRGVNEKIEWQRNDELGSLINEYNRMIDELGRSAELLAKSERESAWREMAKQVAHEIKNPLTPMKLSVQYLKKRWDDKVPNWEEELERFTTTIIQQIDTLSEIASAFSDFAKMPRKKAERIDIEDVVKKSIGLFSEHKNLKIVFNVYDESYVVEADPNQLLRVFNNLIKNSIQAVKPQKNGKITVKLIKVNGNCLVEIIDNGIGIPKDQKDKIFTPNFTTKSSGMGMGLSIVKSIVLESDGRIWFESEENKGTTFFIELPLYVEGKK